MNIKNTINKLTALVNDTVVYECSIINNDNFQWTKDDAEQFAIFYFKTIARLTTICEELVEQDYQAKTLIQTHQQLTAAYFLFIQQIAAKNITEKALCILINTMIHATNIFLQEEQRIKAELTTV